VVRVYFSTFLTIFLGIEDRNQIEKIYLELNEYAPWVTIVATLESVFPDPTGSKAYWDEEIRCGAVSYLDRRAYVEGKIPEKTIDVIRKVADLIIEYAISG